MASTQTLIRAWPERGQHGVCLIANCTRDDTTPFACGGPPEFHLCPDHQRWWYTGERAALEQLMFTSIPA
jgi:hypothetical protein